MSDVKTLLAIAPNFKKRLSGVTSTIIQLVPKMRDMGYDIKTLGPGLPSRIPSISFSDLWKLYKKPVTADIRVFHARRNLEMLFALFITQVLRLPLKIVFTSASQRHHTKYTKWLVSKMDAVIATSSKTGSYLDVPHTVILHGIDTDRFTPTNDKKKHKASLNLDPDAKYIGCFGRLRPSKGTDIYLESMISTLRTKPQWRALILGRATPRFKSFEDELLARIKESGLENQILFLGEHTNIEDYYKALDLYVAPQRYEGFGLTPLEAMACGVPVVATDVGAFSELVPKECGYIVETNAQDISKHVEFYLEDQTLLKTHSKNALAHIQKNFTLDREAQSIIDVYKSLQTETK